MNQKKKSDLDGMMMAILACLMWGLSPLYFKAIQTVNPFEIIAHRIFWSALFLMALVIKNKKVKELYPLFTNLKEFKALLLTSCLISSNWLIYVTAVNSGHLLDAGLGYFITPLFNILFGVLFLSEKLTSAQKISIALATSAVLIQVISLGIFPITALSLTFTFSLYAFLRKKMAVNSLVGLAAETLLLAPFAASFLIYRYTQGNLSFGPSLSLNMALIGLCLLTSLPLLLYVEGTKRLPLSFVGLLQYVSPSTQFLLAVLCFHEELVPIKLYSFILIWIALVIAFIPKSFYTKGLSIKEIEKRPEDEDKQGIL